MTNVLIIGGGLAGLVCANLLAKSGVKVVLIEKKTYPFHRVCGEYISNEVRPFLERNNLLPSNIALPQMNQLLLSSPSGRSFCTKLPLGGFGISRFELDFFLAVKAKENGAGIITGATVSDVAYHPESDNFVVKTTSGQTIDTNLVIGSFGKRSNLDRTLQRPFFVQRSPYIGVKYHVQAHLPKNQIALHNFTDGYCGVSALENNKYNVCYLTTRDNLKNFGNIKELEENVLKKNPYLKDIFSNADFLYDQPEVINEITFAPKSLIQNRILMCGDAARMITPLCGNGMAMAIHSAAILSDLVIQFIKGDLNRFQLEKEYQKIWSGHFSARLRIGRTVQKLFGKPILSELAIGSLARITGLSRFIINQTHGQPF